MRFKITLEHDITQEEKVVYYDTTDSSLVDDSNNKIEIPDSLSNMELGFSGFNRISISLGLKCNLSCNYCLQDKIPKEKTNYLEIDKMLRNIEQKDFNTLSHTMIEFWGGEPLLYLDEIKYIVENLKVKPLVFSIVTNGTLINVDFIKYCIEKNIILCLSHDAQAQHNRGKDTLENKNLIDGLNYYLDNKPMTFFFNSVKFNSVLTTGNYNSKLRKEFFAKKLNRDVNDIILHGEGVVYNIKPDLKIIDTKNLKFNIKNDIKENGIENYKPYFRKLNRFFLGIKFNFKLEDITTKCGIDRPSYEVISIHNKKLTCHNFNNSFKIKMFNEKPECLDCLVAHMCRGGCPAIEKDSEVFEMNCKIKYEENLGVMEAAFAILFNGYEVKNIEKSIKD